jgi:DNA-binding Xre family transcriptional regulator
MRRVRMRVKEIIKEQGRSVASVARKADMDNKTVHRLIKDPYAEATTVTIARLAEALDVSVKDLIEDDYGA